MSERPQNVGILNFSVHVPRFYVDHGDLEQFDSVSAGKYTVGLEQSSMAVSGDNEDACSMALTVVHKLIEDELGPDGFERIGRLEVGTESLVDKSKSIKSCLMQLFEGSGSERNGNSYVEGVDCLNACYGGTAAIFNCVDWVESCAWDGRLAVAVMADVAIYSDKAARPTGGAGAIAFLIGPNAPLVIDSRNRVTVVRNVYDFYKPQMQLEYPMVDGRLSLQCYFEALQLCYQRFKSKLSDENQVILDNHQRCVFHSPFCALVRKAYSLLYLCDHRKRFLEMDPSSFYSDKQMQRNLVNLCKDRFEQQVAASTTLAKVVGNAYTASLYLGLVSCLANGFTSDHQNNGAQNILMYSYGSGYCASMYTIRVLEDQSKPLMEKARKIIDEWKTNRLRLTAANYEKLIEIRKQSMKILTDGIPTQGLRNRFQGAFMDPGAYYIEMIDHKYRRSYRRQDRKIVNGGGDDNDEQASANSFIENSDQ